MEAIVQKWGNSNAIRIPKVVLSSFDIKENDKVEIIMHDNGFFVKKSDEHITLSERVESFYGKPIEQISRVNSDEFDWGEPKGEELW